MPREENQNHNNNEEYTSTIKKIASNLYFVFCGSQDLDPSVNKLIIFTTYMQIFQILHILILYTLFNKTNNFQYDAIQSVFSGLIFAICFIPRVNFKHYGLLLTFIAFIVVTVAAVSSTTLLILNYYTFTHYCSLLSQYSSRNSSFEFTASSVCSTVVNLYHIRIGADSLLYILRFIYIYLNSQAYKLVKHKFDEEEKKKRRAQKFDEKEKNKTTYDPNRKI